jgi:glycosyltransferase involved in cell wall biosynthesis
MESVSLFVHNLGDNPLGRALPIIRALDQMGYGVEVLGFFIGDDEQVYTPYRDEIEVKALHTNLRSPGFFPKIRTLGQAAEGDVIYAFKPLMTSFAPAYFAARIQKERPLILDIEDEEVYNDQILGIRDVWTKVIRGWNLGISWKYTRLLQFLRCDIDAVTVVSTVLQKRHGGTLLRHGPDETRFNPNLDFGSKRELRKKWDTPEEKKLAVFIGTPRSHKGLDTLAAALSRPETEEWAFVHVGPHDNEFTAPLKKKLGDRSYFLGPKEYQHTPEILYLADAVPIPSKDVPFARAQIPAKLLDAMAMARPIVASEIGDLPEILGDGERGWLIDPDSPVELARALQAVAANPDEAEQRGEAARKWYEQNASTTAIAKKLRSILSPLGRGG